MTCNEFSTEFDILYNNATSNQAPPLNSYEKSVVLTQAEEEIVLDLYRGGSLQPFDLTEEVSSYLSPIIKDEIIDGDSLQKYDGTDDNINPLTKEYDVTLVNKINGNNKQDCWFIVYESALVSYADNPCNTEVYSEVIPTTYDTFLRRQKNPFKKPRKGRILRLNIGKPGCNDMPRSLYLVHPKGSTIDSYRYTYLKRPNPIVLENLYEYDGYELSVNGVSEQTECELGSAIHRQILYRAVDIAKAIWNSTIINSDS